MKTATTGSKYTVEQDKNPLTATATDKNGNRYPYKWSHVEELIKGGVWLFDGETIEKPTRENVMDTPDLVEVGDEIVFFSDRKGVEVRRKGTVVEILHGIPVGFGRWANKNGIAIDYALSGQVTTGVFIIKKAEKPIVKTTADKPVGTIMTYTTPYGKKYTNIKATPTKWAEVTKNKLEEAVLSDGFIERMIQDNKGEYLYIPE